MSPRSTCAPCAALPDGDACVAHQEPAAPPELGVEVTRAFHGCRPAGKAQPCPVDRGGCGAGIGAPCLVQRPAAAVDLVRARFVADELRFGIDQIAGILLTEAATLLDSAAKGFV